MEPGIAAIRAFKRGLMKAPVGMVWYVARSFEHAGGWSIHAAVGVRTETDIVFFDLDGAEGDDWMSGPGSFRAKLPFEKFFDVGEDSEEEFLQFDAQHHYCLFLPLSTRSVGSVVATAKRVAEDPAMSTYHYLTCNCQNYSVRVIVELFGGVPELLALVLQKVMPAAHTALVDAGLAADWAATATLGITVIFPPAFFVTMALGPLVAAGAATTGAVAKGITDSFNFQALPDHLGRIVTLPPTFPTLTLQCD
jgi:hypothetical protein